MGRVLGLDVSEGMVKHLNHKLMNDPENEPIREKVKTVLHQITHDTPLPEPEFSEYLAGANGGFDMIFSNMVMHHIEDVQGVVDILANKMLKKDGWLYVVDFLPAKDGQAGHGHHHHQHQHDQTGGHGGCQNQQGQTHGGHGCQNQHDQTQAHGEHGGCAKVVDVNEFFQNDDTGIAKIVAHKAGFSLEEFAQIFKNAGLVDVEAKHSHGMTQAIGEKHVWSDVFIAKGRRA